MLGLPAVNWRVAVSSHEKPKGVSARMYATVLYSCRTVISMSTCLSTMTVSPGWTVESAGGTADKQSSVMPLVVLVNSTIVPLSAAPWLERVKP